MRDQNGIGVGPSGAVRHSVECVQAASKPIDEGEFGAGDNTRWLLKNPRFDGDQPGAQLRLIVRRSAGDNPIEILRIALSRHQRLPPACGASRPVQNRGARS